MAFVDFIGRDPDRADFIRHAMNRQEFPNADAGRVLEATIANMMRKFGASVGPLAFGNLGEILQRQGQTSRIPFNRDIRRIQRDTESQGQAHQGQVARRGFRAGSDDAIAAAIQASGADREAAAFANESELAERRQREDIQLFRETLLDPGLRESALATQRGIARTAQSSAERAAAIEAISNIFRIGGGFG